MKAIDLIIGAGWILFWVYWLIMAAGAKTGKSRWTQLVGVRVALIIVILLLVRLRVLKGHGLPVATNGNPWLLGVGLAVFVLGLALAVWARVYIGRNWGMPMTQKADPELVTTGPYRRIRHPIYTGIILGMVGTTIAVSLYWLSAVVILGGYFIVSAVIEERNMAKLFPATYPPYKHATKMLIPYLL